MEEENKEEKKEDGNEFHPGDIVEIVKDDYPGIENFPKFMVNHQSGEMVSCIFWNGYEMKEFVLHCELLSLWQKPEEEISVDPSLLLKTDKKLSSDDQD